MTRYRYVCHKCAERFDSAIERDEHTEQCEPSPDQVAARIAEAADDQAGCYGN